MPDADDFPVTVKDTYGTPVTVDVVDTDVTIEADEQLVFDPETFEKFSQVLIAARHVADQQAVTP